MKRATTLVLNMLATTNGLPLITVLLLLGLSCVSAKVVPVPSSGRKLKKELYKARAGDTLLLENGVYTGDFILPPQVTLKSKERHKAVINGVNAKVTLSLTNGNILDGITVRNGRIGIYSDGIDNVIKECKITSNVQSGIVAIVDIPQIKDNIIFRNGSSGIQLWDAKRNRGTIENNTIVYNEGHGISVGGKSDLIVKNNIIAYNNQKTINTSGDSTIVHQSNNCYYMNIEINMTLPKDNVSYDPQFMDQRRNNFELKETSPALFDGEDGTILGTRIYQNNNN